MVVFGGGSDLGRGTGPVVAMVGEGGSVKTAFFPGQGSQFVGMGRELSATVPGCPTRFRGGRPVLGFALSRRSVSRVRRSDLRVTQNTQPAIFTHSIAVLRAMEARPQRTFTAAAGHSLGEYTAYVAAGSISFEDGLRLVRRRGELMFKAGLDRPGTMAAILGLDPANAGRRSSKRCPASSYLPI